MNLQERIARVLCKADGYDPEQVRFPDGDMVLGGPFYGTARHHFPDDIGKARWQSPIYQKSASYVLDELMTPSPAMIEAGMDFHPKHLEVRLGRPPTVEECQADEWQAMIIAGKREQ